MILRKFFVKHTSEKFREIFRYWIKSIPAILYRNNLSKLAKLYGTDKFDHGYTTIYPIYFKKIKNKKLRILEIGIGGGQDAQTGGNSLKMWAKYFSNSEIIGIDIYDKSIIDYRRMKTFIGDQSDENFLNQFSNIDIIIDDGGHINHKVIKSFEILFNILTSNGLYIIEDIENSYWKESGGNEEILNDQNTIINYFKSLADSVNIHFMRNVEVKNSLRNDIEFVHFYKNMIVVKKLEVG